MPLIMKFGRCAIVTRGRHAGKKVVLIQPHESSTKSHPFPHAVVIGVDRYPRKITKRMGSKRVKKHSQIKPFIKIVNYNHLMPTRYKLELDSFKNAVSNDTFKEASERKKARKDAKKILEDHFSKGKNRWFFTPLRF